MANTTYNSVTVAATATQVVGGSSARKGMLIVNHSETVTVFVGPDTSITTSNALPLLPLATMSLSGYAEAWKGPVYAIVSSGTLDLRFWEWGQ